MILNELLDEFLKSCKRPEDLLGDAGLMAISDVTGDNPAAIASAPTAPDPTAGEDLAHLVARQGPNLPVPVRDILLRRPCRNPPSRPIAG